MPNLPLPQRVLSMNDVRSQMIENWPHLQSLSNDWCQDVGDPHLAFRGQADESWPLIPTILRGRTRLHEAALLEIERKCLNEFASVAELHFDKTVLPTDPDEDAILTRKCL